MAPKRWTMERKNMGQLSLACTGNVRDNRQPRRLGSVLPSSNAIKVRASAQNYGYCLAFALAYRFRLELRSGYVSVSGVRPSRETAFFVFFLRGGLDAITIQSTHLLGKPRYTLTERLLANLSNCDFSLAPKNGLRWFLSFALCIPTAHNFCVINARAYKT